MCSVSQLHSYCKHCTSAIRTSGIMLEQASVLAGVSWENDGRRLRDEESRARPRSALSGQDCTTLTSIWAPVLVDTYSSIPTSGLQQQLGCQSDCTRQQCTMLAIRNMQQQASCCMGKCPVLC